MVIGQSTQLLYPGPATARSHNYTHETTQGIYDALLRGRFAFDFVHEDRLELERLRKYRALLLPNIAMLSDAQCRQLREYSQAGGSIVASFETSLLDENMSPREDFGLADLLGIGKAGAAVGTNGNPYYGRIERQHALLDGFTDTNWLPGAQNRIPLKPIESPVPTVVPGFVRYPPELAYPAVSHTTEPAVVLRESDMSRTAYFAGDIERTYWLTGHGDFLRLIHNAIRWITHDERVVHAEGEGFIELFAWETGPGYAVHLLNYTTPDAQHGWLQSTYQLGPQVITMKLPPGVTAAKVELLKGERGVPFTMDGQTLRFAVPAVADYEVAAITV